MGELLSSLLFAAVMVPVVMAATIGVIYFLGEMLNRISDFGRKGKVKP